MTHPSDAELDRFRGASDPEAGRRVREHLAGCDDCARRLAELEREERRTEGLLGLLDGAAVIPGSPLRDWLVEVGSGRPSVETPGPAAEPGAEAPAGLPGPGVQFVPSGPLEIEFAASREPGTLRVAWSATSDLTLYAVEGTADFSVGPDRVRVDNWGGGARFELRVPRGLSALRITADGTVLLELAADVPTVPPGLEASALDQGHRLSVPPVGGPRGLPPGRDPP